MRLCEMARYCAFLRILVFLSAFLCIFSCQNGLQKGAKLRINVQKCTQKKRFYAIPSLVIPPFACHMTLKLVGLQLNAEAGAR